MAMKIQQAFEILKPRRGSFTKGNTAALAINLTPEANRRRKRALIRTWATNERKRKGERIMPMVVRHKIARKARIRLRENLAMEAREVQNMARKMAAQAMETLADIFSNSEQDSSRIAAIQVILERAYGKATQPNVNANIDANGKSTEVTAKELDTRIAETLKRVESLTGGTTQEEAGQGGSGDVCVSDRDPGNSSVH